jgi:nicotinate-nucleotide pyrophosphorylase (carboxylating)
MPHPHLNRLLIEPAVRHALAEDFGRRGDLTSHSTVPHGLSATAAIRARDAGRIAGIEAALLAFELVNPEIKSAARIRDGEDAAENAVIAEISGPAADILSAERVALNFISHLSGIATATHSMTSLIGGYKAKLCCTRKTTPGLRLFEKHAVVCGGGVNHRFGLDDALLIKDNHIALAGGIRAAVENARALQGHMLKLEIEVDTLEQLSEVLELKIDAVLLDNMPPETLKKAVDMIGGRAVAEASGRINPKNIVPIAASGVDLISSGWITHSAPILDIGLDIDA